jgi:hypothetical protein
MITEDYVSFEVAKLLREKGFDESCYQKYDDEGYLSFNYVGYINDDKLCEDFYALAPTLQMAMKWLREVYHIEISVTFGFPFIDGKQQYKYFWSIVRVCDNHLEYPMDDPNNAFYNEEMADSYEEAVEAALKYSLENLI